MPSDSLQAGIRSLWKRNTDTISTTLSDEAKAVLSRRANSSSIPSRHHQRKFRNPNVLGGGEGPYDLWPTSSIKYTLYFQPYQFLETSGLLERGHTFRKPLTWRGTRKLFVEVGFHTGCQEHNRIVKHTPVSKIERAGWRWFQASPNRLSKKKVPIPSNALRPLRFFETS